MEREVDVDEVDVRNQRADDVHRRVEVRSDWKRVGRRCNVPMIVVVLHVKILFKQQHGDMWRIIS